MAEQYSYLGSALKYPIEINEFGRVKIVSGLDALKDGLIQMLNTPQGTRFFNPGYGSRLHEILFEPVDEVLQSLIELFIFEAIQENEKRVATLSVTTTLYPDNNLIDCAVQLRILQSNEIDSFIYPFYRELIT
jgi:phage baseplate assembly protein W